MATRQEIEQALVTAKQRYDAAQTDEERAAIKARAQVLVSALENQRPEQQEVPQLDVEELSSKAKTDPQGIAMSVIAGLNRGAVALADLPVDLVNLAVSTVLNPPEQMIEAMKRVPQLRPSAALMDLINKIPKDVKDNLRAARPSEVVGGATEAVTGFNPIEAATTPMPYAADTPAERIAGTIGEYAGGSLATGAAAPRIAQSLLRTPTGAPTATPRIGEQIAAKPMEFARQEALYGTAAGVGGATAREYAPDSPMAEMGAALLTGVGVPVAGQYAAGFKIPFKDSLSSQAVERRVGQAIVESTADVDRALANLTSNRLVVERALGGDAEVNAVKLTQDPTLIGVVEQVAKQDNELISILGRVSDDTDQQLINMFKGLAPTTAKQAGVDVVSSAQEAANTLVLRLQDEIDLAKNAIDRLEGMGAGDTTNISTEFVDALKQSYNRAKQTEREMWQVVDKTEKLNPKDLLTNLKELRKAQRTRAIPKGTIPEDLFASANKLKTNPTFENLSDYRSSLTDARRNSTNKQTQEIIDNMIREVDGFLDGYSSGQAYTNARNFTRTLYSEYDEGKIGKYLSTTKQGNYRVDPEVALSRIVSTGDNVGDIRRVIGLELSPTLPRAEGLTQQVANYLRAKFSDMPLAAKGAGRDAFFNKYKNILTRFPTLAQDLGAINTEIKALSQSIAQKEGRMATPLDEQRTSVSALLGADPDRLIDTLSRFTREDLRLTKEALSQDRVLRGLQSTYLDEFVKALIKTDNNGVLVFKDNNLNNILKNDTTLRLGWDEVLTPDQKKVLARVQKIRNLYAEKQKTGNAEQMLEALKADPLTVLVTRSLAIRGASTAVPSGAASLQAAAAFSNFGRNLINNLTREQALGVLRRAVTDPEYLEQLLKTSKAAQLSGDVEALNAYLFAAGVQNVEGQNRE